MKKVILGIGIPGSGKTTVMKKFAEKYNYSYICPDDIREELTGSSSNQSKNKEVWAEAYTRMKKQLEEGETVVFDATFTNPEQRKEFLVFARKNGAEKIQGVYLDVDLETAQERNELREKKVPNYVLEKMDRSLNEFPPEINDGFDSIFTIDDEQRLIEAEMELENSVIHKEFGKIR